MYSYAFFFRFMLLSAAMIVSATAEEPAPWTVPENKSAGELLEYAQNAIRSKRLSAHSSPEAVLAEIVERAEFLVRVAEAALSQSPSDPLLTKAYMLKFEGLEHLARTNDPEKVRTLERYLDELDRLMPESRESKMARSIDLQRQVGLFAQRNRTEEEYDRIKTNVFNLIRQEPIGYPPGLPMNMVEIAGLAEHLLKKEGLYETTARELIELLRSLREHPDIRDVLRQVEAATHALGQEIALAGTTLDGKTFDIKSLRGKVVLVDFFTSWCIPCIAEFPFLKELYEKYRSRGFEIVGIGMDDVVKIRKLVRDRELPWTVLSEELTRDRRMKSIEKQYAIRRYPTVFLIDRDGKLLDADARGEKLETALKTIFDTPKK